MHFPIFAIILSTVLATSAWGFDDALIIGRDVQLQEKYDFVIVGGGTSGLVIANRLTEQSSSEYLLQR
jgi:hypothetical protein